MLPVLIKRDDLHRYVTRRCVLLELAKHGPPKHVRQEDVERHSSGSYTSRELQCLCATVRDDDLESLVVCEIGEYAGVMRIIFDDEENRVVRLQLVAIVRHPFD